MTIQQSKSQITKEQIQNSALKLFLAQGFEATSIQQITAEAGYATGTFYKCFKSKDVLLTKIWEEYVVDYITTSTTEAYKLSSFEDVISFLIQRSKEYGEHPLYTCYYYSKPSITERLPDTMDIVHGYHEMLKSFIKAAYPAYDTDQLEVVTDTIHSLLNQHAMSRSGVKIYNGYSNANLNHIILHIAKAYE